MALRYRPRRVPPGWLRRTLSGSRTARAGRPRRRALPRRSSVSGTRSAMTAKASSAPLLSWTRPASAETPVSVPVLARTTPTADLLVPGDVAVRPGARPAGDRQPVRGDQRSRGVRTMTRSTPVEHRRAEPVASRQPAAVDHPGTDLDAEPAHLRGDRGRRAGERSPAGAVARATWRARHSAMTLSESAQHLRARARRAAPTARRPAPSPRPALVPGSPATSGTPSRRRATGPAARSGSALRIDVVGAPGPPSAITAVIGAP